MASLTEGESMADNRTLRQKLRGEPDTSGMTRLGAAMKHGKELPPKKSEKKGKDADKKK